MNGAPDWQDGECCFRCRTQFTLVARKHHCRNCGNIFCAKCSSQQIILPKLNIEKSVRVCDGCYDKLSSKNEDPLALAIDKSSESEQTKPKSNSKSTKESSKSTSSNKPAANASAPSEQELKEEEEFQLALALSLSETPAKVSFPECRQFEEASSSTIAKNHTTIEALSTNVVAPQQPPQFTQPAVTSNGPPPEYISITENYPQMPSNPNQIQYQQENKVLDRDQELFRFVADIQSTSEVFTNRVNSSKLRNRPIANDSAIQALFLKLTSMHTKLLEYLKVHDEERAGYEGLQDKLSQISDARAALDALREEHQEKIRQEAADAERQRQSQLALKLEMMRQKKSQMMQYQREVALQRIQAQEMMLRQPQGYQSAVVTSPQQVLPPPQPPQPVQQAPEVQSVPVQQPPINQQQPIFQQHASLPGQQFIPQSQQLQQQRQPIQQLHQADHSIQQSLPAIPISQDEAPLISFDD